MTDQVWFVTGSSRGLGRSVVEEALAAGNRVVATARRTDALADLAATAGPRLLAVPLDVTDPAQASSAIQAAVDAFGRVDVVVNNAGYANMAPVEDMSLGDFRAQVDAVFFGTVYVTKAALPVFRRQGSGYFIQVTSIGGRLTAPGLGRGGGQRVAPGVLQVGVGHGGQAGYVGGQVDLVQLQILLRRLVVTRAGERRGGHAESQPAADCNKQGQKARRTKSLHKFS